MGSVLTVLVAALLVIAGMVVSLVGAGWLGALLCTIGVAVALAALVSPSRTA